VVTFIGEPKPVKEAAFRAVQKAAELIDMSKHQGEHARFGATDVCPFVPVAGATMEDCAAIAREVGQRIGEELGIPVYLYEHAASTPARSNLADVRSGEYEGLQGKLTKAKWKPDFGPAAFNAQSGATAVGAREFLIAYNINLNTTDRRYANEIAYEIRERGRWKRAGNIQPFFPGHGFPGILQKHGDGHGPHTAGNRGDSACNFPGFFKGDIAYQAVTAFASFVLDAINPHINHDCTGFNPIAAHKFRNTYCSDQDICFACERGDIYCARVTNGDGAVGFDQQQADGHANDV